jgi:hypothetical protein
MLLLVAGASAVAGEATLSSPKGGVVVGVQTAEAKSLVGRWSGRTLGRKIGSMATVQVDIAAVGLPSGSTEYFLRSVSGFDKLACRGYLKLVEASGTRFVFEESVTERGRGHDGGCPIVGRLELSVTGDGVAAVQWIRTDGTQEVIQSGELVRQ